MEENFFWNIIIFDLKKISVFCWINYDEAEKNQVLVLLTTSIWFKIMSYYITMPWSCVRVDVRV